MLGEHPISVGASGHRLAPAGTGFLYLRKDRANSVWTTLASTHWNDHADDGYRLSQRGTGSLSLLVGCEAAVDFHNSIGPERVYTRVKQLGDYLRGGLRQIGGKQVDPVQLEVPARRCEVEIASGPHHRHSFQRVAQTEVEQPALAGHELQPRIAAAE